MKLIILREHLNRALSIVEKSLGTNELMPILKNVVIRTEQGKIHLITTNLETAIIATLNGKIEEEGDVAVSGSGLLQVISNLKDEKIHVVTDNQKLLITTDTFQGELVTVSLTDFPLIPKVQSDSYIDVSVKALHRALDMVSLAISPHTIRQELNGVFFTFKNHDLVCVGSDGFRLSEKKINIISSTIEEMQCIIPSRTIQLLSRVMEYTSSETIRIAIEAHQCIFLVNEYTLISNCVDGNYPSYENFVPKDFDTEILINKVTLADAVRLCNVFSSRLNDITIHILPKDNSITIRSSNAILGSGEITIQGQVTGIEQSFRMNARYFQDGLKSIDDTNLKISIVNAEKPIKIEPIVDKNGYAIIMPIKMN
ncbi:MAG: DNA polymerase III subunit beta [Patescibacteria group bacterium]|nr:DNA polymerase III subunit beta [Patescibacteria group bacterium]MDE2438500.1 DNA polymerase III subunit beta [Patescibacteria group bacterium]